MHSLAIASSPAIVGILNVTPDSYFDGGKFVDVSAAVLRAEELMMQGADIIEIGGESTGPGSADVSTEEELARTIPVIKAIKERFPDVRLSIDTYKAEVAKQAIDAGVTMVNDVTAGRGDPELFSIVKAADCDLVLMYAKDPSPRTTATEKSYTNVIQYVKDFLQIRNDAAMDAGIDRSRIIIDPGLGHFVSSDPSYSFELIKNLDQFSVLAPIFLSPSRKSFVAGSESLKTADRLPGTIAASAIAVLNGASYIRTHDVLEVRRACEIAAAIRDS